MKRACTCLETKLKIHPVEYFLLDPRIPPLAKQRRNRGLPGGSVVKNLPFNSGDAGSIPGPGRSYREENVNPLQYSRLENPMDIGPWWATVRGVAKNWTQLKPLSSHSPFRIYFKS